MAMSTKPSGNKKAESKKAPSGGAPRAGLQKQLHKTKFCMYYLQGNCRFGTECAFAHSLNEIHNTPDLRKTQLCKAFLEGKCNNDACDFAHDDCELRSTDICFKKTLCIWNEKGKCRNGAQCRFAHGIKELRSEQEAMQLAELGLGAEAGSEQGRSQKSQNNGSPCQGKKSMGSSSSSVSCQSGESTASGSSGGPSGSGGGSGNNSGSSGYHCSSGDGSRMVGPQNEPMKVLQFDASPLARIEDLVANRPSQQTRFASNMVSQPSLANAPVPPHLAEALRALQHELHSLNSSQLETLGHDNSQSQRQQNLHMELDVLRQTAALLTARCVNLQERVNVGGSGFPGVASNMDVEGLVGHCLGRNVGPASYLAQTPPGLSRAVHSGLDYSVGDPSLQAAHFGQAFGAASGVCRMQAARANAGYFF